VNLVGIQGLNGEVSEPAVLEAIGVGVDDPRYNQTPGLEISRRPDPGKIATDQAFRG